MTIAAFFAKDSDVIEITKIKKGICRYLIIDMVGIINIRLSLLTIEKTSLNSLKSAYLLYNEIK